MGMPIRWWETSGDRVVAFFAFGVYTICVVRGCIINPIDFSSIVAGSFGVFVMIGYVVLTEPKGG